MRFLAIALLVTPLTLYAAVPFSGLILSQQPQVARPQSEVTITATSIDRAVDVLEFIWKVDGEIVANQIGLASLTVTAPAVGDSIIVSVEVRSGGRTYASETLVIRPAALYLESDGKSSVPPFYIGERLPAVQGRVVFTAIPNFVLENGARLSPNDLLFEWRVNGIQKIKPALGKSSAEFEVPFFGKPFTVAVTAYSRDGTLRAEESSFVIPTAPDIVVYESSPLSGILDQRAVHDQYLLKSEEVTLVAYPLFTRNSEDIELNWSLNNSPVELPENESRSVTFRKTAEGSGAYQVGVAFSNPLLFLERASRAFLLQF